MFSRMTEFMNKEGTVFYELSLYIYIYFFFKSIVRLKTINDNLLALAVIVIKHVYPLG